jgi:hypothetical protein
MSQQRSALVWLTRADAGSQTERPNVRNPSGLRDGFAPLSEKRVALRRLSTFLAPFSEKGRSGRGACQYPGRRCGRGILHQAGLASVCRIRPRSIAMRPARVRAR